ncbi:cytochrome P460 family protein [Acidiphilium multivorum]|uniref:cytochrome P460 family protein n=1 Tax=Acidiphilium multivorum TaxID=62140 RepID=UPI001B8C0AFB|nr:cytochrome P460 family protein [Acidiphilium multivorum]
MATRMATIIKVALLSAATIVGQVATGHADTQPVAAPKPAQLWQQITALEKAKSIMPGSHALQPGSRLVDFYTTDLSNKVATEKIKLAGSIVDVTKYPDGSLLVKNNYKKNHELGSITAMLKMTGYDKANRNWVMAAYSPTGKVIAYGKVASCDACHAFVAKSDFVFAPPPTQLLKVSIWKAFFPKQKISPTYVALLAKYPNAIIK